MRNFADFSRTTGEHTVTYGVIEGLRAAGIRVRKALNLDGGRSSELWVGQVVKP